MDPLEISSVIAHMRHCRALLQENCAVMAATWGEMLVPDDDAPDLEQRTYDTLQIDCEMLSCEIEDGFGRLDRAGVFDQLLEGAR